ncbi:MAG: ATP-binding protein, partial [Bacteriovoracaceae bacterium]|nr:ATP-binding protein [Bacteriovoracaceae bacterium]
YGTGDVRLFFTIKNNSLGLSIQNNGPFPYKNLDDTLKNASPSNQGLGMGLSIVKTLAESMGGKLTLTLKPTTFTIWFHYES